MRRMQISLFIGIHRHRMLISGRHYFMRQDRSDWLLASDDRHREKRAEHQYHWQVFHFVLSLQGVVIHWTSIGRANSWNRNSRPLTKCYEAIHVEITYLKKSRLAVEDHLRMVEEGDQRDSANRVPYQYRRQVITQHVAPRQRSPRDKKEPVHRSGDSMRQTAESH